MNALKKYVPVALPYVLAILLGLAVYLHLISSDVAMVVALALPSPVQHLFSAGLKMIAKAPESAALPAPAPAPAPKDPQP